MADYDYIIVGAGSAGGTLAARLTENPANKVLLLEAGAASHPYSRMPLSFGLLIDNPGGQLALPVRAGARHGQPRHPGAARQAARRLQLDQRPGLGARPAARLSTPGRRWATAAGAGSDVAPLFTRIENFETATAPTAAAPAGR